PPFLGLPPGTMIPMEAVPTTVIEGPNGNYYVGQLTGFPFPAGGANIYSVPKSGGTPTVALSGFTNIIDIAPGPDGALYFLEISKNGLLSSNPAGALIRVAPNGTRTEVAARHLTTPGGIVFGDDGAIYVTTTRHRQEAARCFASSSRRPHKNLDFPPFTVGASITARVSLIAGKTHSHFLGGQYLYKAG